jgi:hypothetical protein
MFYDSRAGQGDVKLAAHSPERGTAIPRLATPSPHLSHRGSLVPHQEERDHVIVSEGEKWSYRANIFLNITLFRISISGLVHRNYAVASNTYYSITL